MLEQIIEKFEFMNSLIDILNPLELYEFLNHQKMLEVVDSGHERTGKSSSLLYFDCSTHKE